MIMFALD
jgi:zinc transporter 9